MRKFVLSLVAVAAIALPALAGKYNKVVSVGEKAPTFSGLPAVYNSEDTSVSLPDIKEDVVVLVFLANHCPVVLDYEDRIIEFTNAYKDKGVRVVGISVSKMEQDKLPGIKEYMKEHNSRATSTATTRPRPSARRTARPIPRSSSSSTRSGRSATPARWTTAGKRRRSPRTTSVTRSTPCSRARAPRSTRRGPWAAVSRTAK